MQTVDVSLKTLFSHCLFQKHTNSHHSTDLITYCKNVCMCVIVNFWKLKNNLEKCLSIWSTLTCPPADWVGGNPHPFAFCRQGFYCEAQILACPADSLQSRNKCLHLVLPPLASGGTAGSSVGAQHREGGREARRACTSADERLWEMLAGSSLKWHQEHIVSSSLWSICGLGISDVEVIIDKQPGSFRGPAFSGIEIFFRSCLFTSFHENVQRRQGSSLKIQTLSPKNAERRKVRAKGQRLSQNVFLYFSCFLKKE